ncbi:hypothetical protein [Aquabacterium parvum]|uniref:hypothetical protein n=1 Tax=Aquabacterium parvum TaxID=70584 RepID=UPI000718EC5A|nr:hypothetical protein [Aquabacterium parvum]
MKKHEHYRHGGFDGALADVYYNANAPLPALYSPTKLQSGIVAKFSKKMGAHGVTSTLGWVKHIRHESIEYTTEKDSVSRLRKYPTAKSTPQWRDALSA